MPWFFRPSRHHSLRTGSPVCAGQPGHFHRHVHTKRRGNGIPAGSHLMHQLFVCPRCGARHWRYLG